MKKDTNIHSLRAERFKKSIKESKYSQKEIAKELYCSEAAISSKCNGKREIQMQDAVRLAKLLQIRFQYLWGEDDYETKYEALQGAVDNSRPAWYLSQFLETFGVFTDFDMERVDHSTVHKYSGCTFTDPSNTRYKCSEEEMKELVQDVADYAIMRIQKKLEKV